MGAGRAAAHPGRHPYCPTRALTSPPERPRLHAPLRPPRPMQGRAGQLLGRTFSAPKKWLPGKGRVTMQFGCCYNYATDAQGRPPGEKKRQCAALPRVWVRLWLPGRVDDGGLRWSAGAAAGGALRPSAGMDAGAGSACAPGSGGPPARCQLCLRPSSRPTPPCTSHPPARHHPRGSGGADAAAAARAVPPPGALGRAAARARAQLGHRQHLRAGRWGALYELSYCVVGRSV